MLHARQVRPLERCWLSIGTAPDYLAITTLKQQSPPFPLSQWTSPADPPTSLEQLFRLWGVDASLRRYHGRSLGIEHLYPWQAKCLALPGVAAGDRDLLYFAPTSGGKTMVAELLLLLRVLGRPRACSREEGGGGAAATESGRVVPLQQKGVIWRDERLGRRYFGT